MSAWDALTYDPKIQLLCLRTDGPAPFNPLVRGDDRTPTPSWRWTPTQAV